MNKNEINAHKVKFATIIDEPLKDIYILYIFEYNY